MKNVPVLPVGVDKQIVYIFFLPGEITPGDRTFHITRTADGLLFQGEDDVSFLVNLEVEPRLRASKHVVLMTSGEDPEAIGRAKLEWP